MEYLDPGFFLSGILTGFIGWLWWLLRKAMENTKLYRDKTSEKLQEIDKRLSIAEHDMVQRQDVIRTVYQDIDKLENVTHELQMDLAKLPRRESDKEKR